MEDRASFLRAYREAFPTIIDVPTAQDAHIFAYNQYYEHWRAALDWDEFETANIAKRKRWQAWEAFITAHGMEAEFEEIRNDIADEYY